MKSTWNKPLLEGVYMTPEMKFRFAMKKILFYIVFSLRAKRNNFLFIHFDLLIYYFCFDKIIACADVSLGMISFRGSRIHQSPN